MKTWLEWYKGKTKNHIYRIYNGKKYNDYELKTLNIASQSCGDLSDFFFNEKLEITISNKKAQKVINECLEQNGFLDNANSLMQLTKALGTGAFVPYLDDEVLRINYLNATNIVILSSNKREVKEVLFWNEEKTVKGTELTINAHILDENDNYIIYNRKYVKSFNDSDYVKEDLGELEKIETKSSLPKFAVIYTPEINNLDINSCYGISCYANALDNILSVDKAFDTLDNEIWLGRKRVYVPTSAAKFNTDEQGNITPIFDPSDVAFYGVPDKEGKEMLKESSFDLRIDELTQALQAQLNLYTSKVGLGHNYYKFKDGEVYVNTDNVMSSNSDVYRKIKKQENIITKAITQLCYAIAELVGITGRFSVSVYYDDSIIEDKDKIRTQAQSEYNSKLISKAQYYRDVYKLKDEEALQFAEQMNEEIQNQTIVDGSEFGLDE